MHASHKTRRIQGENRKFTLWGLVRSLLFSMVPATRVFCPPLIYSQSRGCPNTATREEQSASEACSYALAFAYAYRDIFSIVLRQKINKSETQKSCSCNIYYDSTMTLPCFLRQSEDRCSQAFNGGLRRGRGWRESARYRKARQWSTISRRKWAIPVKENIRKCKCKLVYSGRASQFTGSLF